MQTMPVGRNENQDSVNSTLFQLSYLLIVLLAHTHMPRGVRSVQAQAWGKITPAGLAS